MRFKAVEEPFKLIWPIFPSGYVWRSGTNGSKSRYLVPANPVEQPKFYEPLLLRTGLFKEFSELPLTETSFCEFANANGLLGRAFDVDRPQLLAESCFEWEDSVLRMRPLVKLWQSIRTANVRALASIGKWTNGEFAYEFGETLRFGDRMFIPESGALQGYELSSAGIVDGDIVSAARLVLQRHINRQLRVFPTLPALLIDRDATLRLYMQPQSLAAVLWIQFSQVVAENRTLRQCPVCRRWFQVGGASGKRADAVTCGLNCRVEQLRSKRKESAMQDLKAPRKSRRKRNTDERL